ncbi:MAG TPA: hypothetical protein VGK89_15060 [Candidatus Eisenbacteria bacterium]|jgi:hypothetical protein
MSRSAGYLAFRPTGWSATTPSVSEYRASTRYAMPVRLETRLRVSESNGRAGPLVTLQATIVLSSLEARVVFRGAGFEEQGTVFEVAQHVPLVPPGEQIARPASPLRRIGPECGITLGIRDDEGHALCEDREIARCVDGVHEFGIPFAVETSAVAWVAARDWSEQRGPRIRLSGELIFTRGVAMRLGFRPLDRESEGSSEGVTEVQLARPGLSLYFPGRTVEAGHPENTWVAVQFVDPGGRPIGERHVVGRCTRD